MFNSYRLLNSSYSNVVYEARKRLLVGILECRLRLFISHFVFICKVRRHCCRVFISFSKKGFRKTHDDNKKECSSAQDHSLGRP